MRRLILLVILLCSSQIIKAAVNYILKFEAPQTHYTEVEMHVSNWNAGQLTLKLPVWTPGSYLVREFSRHVESFEAKDKSGKKLEVTRTSKNAWTINTQNVKDIIVNYKVYAFELSVRTSFIDAEHAYLNGTSIFMYADELMKEECIVEVRPWKDWKIISVALDRVKDSDPWKVKAPDYDVLVDSPFEIGNHKLLTYTVAGIPHEIAMFGEANYDPVKIVNDFKKISEECLRIFGEHPCKRYLFIVHNLPSGGGGLEHLNSTTLQMSRWNYTSSSSYNGFLSLVAHEYFHLWNVKRLRPAPLGPFNYDAENYTSLLYFAEGFTAYYDDLITRRCGYYSADEYLDILSGSFSYTDNIPGGRVLSVADAGFDAWIKFYRPHENSSNSAVSYYTKGSVIAALVDFIILESSNGSKNIDDLMRYMYSEYYKKQNRGFTDREFIDAVNHVSGKNNDAFFQKYVYGTEKIPFPEFVIKTGLRITDLNEKNNSPSTGITTSFSSGKLIVTGVERNSPAWNAGINVNDELLAVDDLRLADDMNRFLNMKKVGDAVKFTVTRAGFIKTIPLTLQRSPSVKYKLEPDPSASEDAKKRLEIWLGK